MRFAPRARLASGGRSTIPTLGRLSVHNALAGAAVGLAAGLDPRRDRARPRAAAGPRRIGSSVVRLGGVTVIDDSYNASPGSMRRRARPAGRRCPAATWRVLGEMLELGDAHDDGHRAVGEAAAATVDRLDRRRRRRAGDRRGCGRGRPRRARQRPRTSPTRRRRSTPSSAPPRRRRRPGQGVARDRPRPRSSTPLRRELGAARARDDRRAASRACCWPSRSSSSSCRRTSGCSSALGLRQAHPRRRARRATTSRKARRRWAGCSIVGVGHRRSTSSCGAGPDASTFAPLAALAGVGALGAFDDYLNARTGEGITRPPEARSG